MKTANLQVLLSNNLLEAIAATMLVSIAHAFPSMRVAVGVCFIAIIVVILITLLLDEWVAGEEHKTLWALIAVNFIALTFGIVVGLL
ncbi:hypothetical protein NDA01_23995 [Trichocoleus desertorum AS-A10]|uniref:hypothetical protein n=1 Tax=Trichocoleus desertorum TaxID=1481672 RepID=UPI00329A774B